MTLQTLLRGTTDIIFGVLWLSLPSLVGAALWLALTLYLGGNI